GNILADPLTSAWNTTNYTLGTFKTTAGAPNPAQAGAFTDSLIIAAKLGTITLPGVNTGLPAGSPTFSFGVGFRKSTAGQGSVTIEGTLRNPLPLPNGFTKNNVFFYRGLAG